MPKVRKSKTRRKDESVSSSDSELSSAEDIEVDFEAFGICDKDTDGIISLLKRAFVNEDLNIDEVANVLTHQDGRGCIFMTALDDDESSVVQEVSKNVDTDDIDNEIYGLVSFIDLQEHRDKAIVRQIKSLIQKHNEHNKDADSRRKFNDLIENFANRSVALIVNERLSNLPYHIALPAFQALQKELNQVSGRINEFLMFVKIHRLSNQAPQTTNNPKQRIAEKSKRKRKSASLNSEQANEIFLNAEEELLSEDCPIQFEYETSTNQENPDTDLKYFKRVLLFDRSILDRFVQKMADDVKMYCT